MREGGGKGGRKKIPSAFCLIFTFTGHRRFKKNVLLLDKQKTLKLFRERNSFYLEGFFT